uniref:Sema domain-containing protein n=1 Tax=Oryzias sinensis TaxID=183150 RepID=A0A8C7YLV5_9TELE
MIMLFLVKNKKTCVDLKDMVSAEQQLFIRNVSLLLSPWISIFSQPGVKDYSQLTLDLTRNELIVGARNYLFRLDLNNMSLAQVSKHLFLCGFKVSIWRIFMSPLNPFIVLLYCSYEIGLFTFFFLRENAVEHDCGKTVYSRVARVCKNDIGGRFLLEDTWTTFMKARLNCSRSGEIPFYYNELQSTFYLPEQDLIYGIFTTNVNSIAASAVCAFNLSAITQAFNGPFRSQENPRSTWLPTPNPIRDFQCGTISDHGPNEGLTERSLQDAQRLYLMNDVVQPESVDPLVMQDDIRFSNLVVDIVQGMDTLYHVMYISTEYGTILKALATPNKNLQGCYLEEMELLPPGVQEPILSLQILHSDRSLFVGLSDRVMKIPLERCGTYKTETMCLEARDPYCGWDFRQRRCTTLEDSSNMSQWKQNITVCPLRNQTTNGGFGPWAQWQPCNNDDPVDGVSSCLCRSRSCDSPLPRCGGKNCVGTTIEVSNCSRNGGWTPWSSWGQCSTTCGTGFELRQRSCNNPSPRHGGRVCVGPSRDERFCNEGVPCPQPIFWTPWSSWTKCSTACGGGVHSRVRTCENGNSCPGCALEYKACNLEACPEVKRNTPWTPWMPFNVTQSGARHEQRTRYMCRAHLSDPHELQIGRRKTETRICKHDGTAACETDSLVEELLKIPVVRVAGLGWSSWETWSSCSQSCSKGYRTRRRTCAGPEGKSAPVACRGSPVEYQDCNVQACPVNGAWSCWSPWSQCSVGCGGGHYQRTRSCNSPTPASGGDICIGLHTEEALCNTHTCDGGWMTWSQWSACDDSGLQMRSRVCGSQSSIPCVGNSTQRRDCNEIPAFTSIHLIATGVSCFLGAGLLSFLIYVYCQRFHKPSQESAVIHPTTPNHLNYKGNTTPKNEKYTPMEFKTLNKNNLNPDERSNLYPTPLQQTNVYTTTYYPTTLGKFDYQPNSSPSPCRTYNNSNNS